MKKLTLLFGLIFIFLIQSCATVKAVETNEHKKAPDRFVFKDDKTELYGLMDEKGNVLLEPAYKYIDKRENGFIPAFTRDNYFVFLDDNGKVLGDNKFYDISFMPYNNCVLVKDAETEKVGVINESGEYVFPPLFDALYGYFDDETMLAKQGKRTGIINHKGKFIKDVPFRIEQVRIYLNGLMEVYKEDVFDFSHDFMFQAKNSTQNHRLGIFDSKQGKYLPIKYDSLIALSKNRKVLAREGREIYLFSADENRKEIIADDVFGYDYNKVIRDNYYQIDYSTKDHHKMLLFFSAEEGLICEKKDEIDNDIFEDRKNVSRDEILDYCAGKKIENPAANEKVLNDIKITACKRCLKKNEEERQEDLYGLVDKTGKVLLEEKYTAIFFIDKNEVYFENEETGERGIYKYFPTKITLSEIVDYSEYKISPSWITKNVVFAFNKENKCGVLDFKGNVVTDFKYNEISQNSNISYFYKAKMGNKYAVLNNKGRAITSPIYDWVSFYNNYIFSVLQGDKSYILNREGKEIRKGSLDFAVIEDEERRPSLVLTCTFSLENLSEKRTCSTLVFEPWNDPSYNFWKRRTRLLEYLGIKEDKKE